jgi:hypothetical protein
MVVIIHRRSAERFYETAGSGSFCGGGALFFYASSAALRENIIKK